MKKIWQIDFPKKNGWYWMQYRGKRGRVCVPAEVDWIDGKVGGVLDGEPVCFVRTALNDTLTSRPHDLERWGWYLFGPKIEMPPCELGAKA